MTTTEIPMGQHEMRLTSIDKPGYVHLAASCSRCGGSGIWNGGWRSGVCFRCGGNGQDPTGDRTYCYPASWTDEQVADHVAKREARRVAAAERKAAKAAAKLDGFRAEFPDVWDALEANEANYARLCEIIDADPDARPDIEVNGFLGSVRGQLHRNGELTDRQIEAVRESVARSAERAAEKAEAEANRPADEPLPTGKAITVEGDVAVVKVQENQFGGTLKMLVLGNGWKVWSTVPSGSERLAPEDGVKVRVRFTADVEASRDDPTFGIAKRPRKLEITG